MDPTQASDKEPEKRFFIFGHNISHTFSPTLHNTGFEDLGLPYQYGVHQSPSVDETVEEILKRQDFGGSSVKFPHKLQIGRLLDSVSPCAEKIVAANTVVVDVDPSSGQRQLCGDNTDWHGIRRCIERSGMQELQSSAALILGAGGAARAACFAVQELGIGEFLIVNRTVSKAQDMGKMFPGIKTARIFDTLENAAASRREQGEPSKAPIRVVTACVPADDLTEDKIPAELFSGAGSGVLVEMAYRPQVTGMMFTASHHDGWQIFKGVDVLEEQAYAQFWLWTGRKAPVEVMRAAMQAKIKENAQAEASR